METITLEAKKREPRGKGGARELRRAGSLPAVLYGGKDGPTPLSLELHPMERLVSSKKAEQAILSIKVGKRKKQLAMIKEIQNDIITQKLLHVDLFRISLDKKVQVNVPLNLLNAEGVKKSGGVLQQTVTELAVECLPTQIPENIPIEIGELQIGDSISVGDIEVGDEVTVLSDPGEVLLSVLAPAKIEEEKPPEEEEAEEGEAAEGEEPEGEAAEGEAAKDQKEAPVEEAADEAKGKKEKGKKGKKEKKEK